LASCFGERDTTSTTATPVDTAGAREVVSRTAFTGAEGSFVA